MRLQFISVYCSLGVAVSHFTAVLVPLGFEGSLEAVTQERHYRSTTLLTVLWPYIALQRI